MTQGRVPIHSPDRASRLSLRYYSTSASCEMRAVASGTGHRHGAFLELKQSARWTMMMMRTAPSESSGLGRVPMGTVVEVKHMRGRRSNQVAAGATVLHILFDRRRF